MMVLDEPTNDLDMDTLELLEDLLADYEGTLLLVSHDRAFLDNVVTSTLVFEGEGRVGEYVGGYEDWERSRQLVAVRTGPAKNTGPLQAVSALPGEKRGNGTLKLSYKEQRELEALPGKIESLEAEQCQLNLVAREADFYRQPADKIAASMRRLEMLKIELEDCYARWESLESRANAAGH
jgi:ATP-binding cassette subfamily F protein uup